MQSHDERPVPGRGAGRDEPSGGGDGPPGEPPELDAVWRALSNATRRAMLDLLEGGALTTGDLADRFPHLSRFAVMQHLRVLVEADLVVVVREGRLRYNYLNPVPIQQIYDRWVSRYMQPWTNALTSLKDELESRSEQTA